MKHFLKLFCLGAAVAVTPFANATPLTLNTIAAGSYGAGVLGGYINGTVTPTANAGDPAPFTAQYQEQVYRGGSSSSVMCATCLNFAFQFTNTGSVNDPILQASMTSFGSFLTTAGFVDSGLIAPTSASRSGAVASTVTFNFDPNGVGNTSGSNTTDVFIVFTNATTFGPGAINFADGATVTGPAYLPTGGATTPEPSSLVLLGSGLVSAAGMLIRRRRIV